MLHMVSSALLFLLVAYASTGCALLLLSKTRQVSILTCLPWLVAETCAWVGLLQGLWSDSPPHAMSIFSDSVSVDTLWSMALSILVTLTLNFFLIDVGLYLLHCGTCNESPSLSSYFEWGRAHDLAYLLSIPLLWTALSGGLNLALLLQSHHQAEPATPYFFLPVFLFMSVFLSVLSCQPSSGQKQGLIVTGSLLSWLCVGGFVAAPLLWKEGMYVQDIWQSMG